MTWERAEALFRMLPLEGRTLTRDTKRGVLYARGTRRGLEVLVEIDARTSIGVDIEVESQSSLEEMELHYRPDDEPDPKHPHRVFFGDGLFAEEEDSASVLHAMPSSLREQILTAMTAYELDTLCIWEDKTTLGSRHPPTFEDPHGTIQAMLDFVVDLAEYAAKHDTNASPE